MEPSLILVSLQTACALASALAVGWVRQRQPIHIGRAFTALMAAIAVWNIFTALQMTSVNPANALLWYRFAYSAGSVVPTLWLIFVLAYFNRLGWLDRRILALLAVVPLLSILIVWTNDWHDLVWSDYLLRTEGNGLTWLELDWGPWRVLLWLHAYTMLLASLGFIVQSARRLHLPSTSPHIVAMVGALIIAMASGLVSVAVESGPSTLPPLISAVAGLIIAVGALRRGAFDLVPVAYDLALESLPDFVYIVDNDNRLMTVNKTAREQIGRRLQDIAGQHVRDVFPDTYHLTEHLADATDLHTEIEVNDRVIDLNITALRDRLGRVRGRVIVARDVTARKQVEAARERQVERLSVIRQVDEEIGSTLNIDSVLPVALDAAMRLSRARAGFIALAQEDDVIVSHVLGDYPEPLAVGVRLEQGTGIAGRAITDRRPVLVHELSEDADFVADFPGARSRSGATMVIPLISAERFIGLLNLDTDQPDRFTGDVFAFIQMIANRIASAVENAQLYRELDAQFNTMRGLYEQVSELEQVKSDMIRVASHDLRNPLGAVHGYLQLLDMDRDQFAQLHRDYFTAMRDAVDRMRGIVEDILSLERIEEMAQQDTGVPVDLAEQAARAVHEHAAQAAQHDLTLKLEENGVDSLPVVGDVYQLYEAMTNLIGNAIKYTPAGGTVTVRLRRDDNWGVFEVVDTGYGIPADKQARLFQPFYRVSTPETAAVEGTGLGLHLVHNIVKRHRGEIIMESAHGEGSTFGFRLPIIPTSSD
jgi:PAS domain S-box-containing protein